MSEEVYTRWSACHDCPLGRVKETGGVSRTYVLKGLGLRVIDVMSKACLNLTRPTFVLVLSEVFIYLYAATFAQRDLHERYMAVCIPTNRRKKGRGSNAMKGKGGGLRRSMVFQ
jgi:hypothetical protein